jgi:hypothetical protein
MLPSLRPLEVEKLASKPKSTVRTKETRCFFKIEYLIDEPESGTMLPGAASYVDCPNKEAELWASPNDLLEPSFVVPQPLKTLQTESCYYKSHDVEKFQCNTCRRSRAYANMTYEAHTAKLSTTASSAKLTIIASEQGQNALHWSSDLLALLAVFFFKRNLQVCPVLTVAGRPRPRGINSAQRPA